MAQSGLSIVGFSSLRQKVAGAFTKSSNTESAGKFNLIGLQAAPQLQTILHTAKARVQGVLAPASQKNAAAVRSKIENSKLKINCLRCQPLGSCFGVAKVPISGRSRM